MHLLLFISFCLTAAVRLNVALALALILGLTLVMSGDIYCNGLCSSVLSAAVAPPCSAVYRGFANCLVTLGDSVSSKTDNPQDINSICKSWDAFQVCVSDVLSGCRGDAAEIWESLRAESRKTAFAGNLYDMCARRTEAVTATTPQGLPSTDQTNQESLKGFAHSGKHSASTELLLTCFTLLLLLSFSWTDAIGQ